MAAQGISGSCTRGQLIYQADCWRNIAISYRPAVKPCNGLVYIGGLQRLTPAHRGEILGCCQLGESCHARPGPAKSYRSLYQRLVNNTCQFHIKGISNDSIVT
jgi:hypothetical protein